MQEFIHNYPIISVILYASAWVVLYWLCYKWERRKNKKNKDYDKD